MRPRGVSFSALPRRHGYALTVHGTMARDLDLVAIPWTDDAEPSEKLIKAFCRALKDRRVAYQLPVKTPKPHGRTAYTFPLSDGYIDLSVMPRAGELQG